MPRRPNIDTHLAAKVAGVLRAVRKLERKGHNQNGDYEYTRATDVFEAVRNRLFSRGILLLPDEGEPDYVTIQTNAGDSLTECRLPVTYTFTDGITSLPPLRCNGAGRAKDEKALYIAQTGAEKAFLKRIGLMAEKIDDPEFEHQDDPATETLEDIAPRRIPRREQPIREFEIHAIEDACANTQKTAAEISEVMLTTFKVSKVTELHRWQFKQALAWASNGAGTLTPKPVADRALQANLPLPKPAPSFEMRVGGQTHVIEPKTGSFSI